METALLTALKFTDGWFIDRPFRGNSRYLDQAGIPELARRWARRRWHVSKLGQELVQCGHSVVYRSQLCRVERNLLPHTQQVRFPFE